VLTDKRLKPLPALPKEGITLGLIVSVVAITPLVLAPTTFTQTKQPRT
jgi:hypothetical protein